MAILLSSSNLSTFKKEYAWILHLQLAELQIKKSRILVSFKLILLNFVHTSVHLP